MILKVINDYIDNMITYFPQTSSPVADSITIIANQEEQAKAENFQLLNPTEDQLKLVNLFTLYNGICNAKRLNIDDYNRYLTLSEEFRRISPDIFQEFITLKRKINEKFPSVDCSTGISEKGTSVYNNEDKFVLRTLAYEMHSGADTKKYEKALESAKIYYVNPLSTLESEKGYWAKKIADERSNKSVGMDLD